MIIYLHPMAGVDNAVGQKFYIQKPFGTLLICCKLFPIKLLSDSFPYMNN